jgi:hypothetical protein
MSLPTAEAENERAFSIRKFVVGRVTARVRARMEAARPEQWQVIIRSAWSKKGAKK